MWVTLQLIKITYIVMFKYYLENILTAIYFRYLFNF